MCLSHDLQNKTPTAPSFADIRKDAHFFFLSGNQQNAAFCFVSLANIFCCFLSMALIFIPKVLFIRAHSHDPREKEDNERETAEQELRYRDLLKANEELQRKVAEASPM